jgi:RimJ/RimL family protein N-acetyltransferase
MSKVLIRPARAADKSAVEKVCARAWDEGSEDYVPQVWDEWLADPHGQLVVAEANGQVAALGKLSRLADDGSTELAEVEWWLEGLRVDPVYRRRGVAGQIQAHLTEQARRVGRGTLRYATSSANEAVHRISARLGFRHVATYRVYKAEALEPGCVLPLRRLNETDLPAAWALVSTSPRYRAGGGLYDVSWKWENLTRERLAHHLTAGEAWGVNVRHGLTGLALVYQDGDDGTLYVGYADGSNDALPAILQGLRGLAAQQGRAEAHFKPVDEPALVAAVEAAGYERVWERNVWIFEASLEEASTC